VTSSDGDRRAAPGWYQDIQANVLRYWDGHQWTNATQPIPPALPSPQRRKIPSKALVLGAIGGVALIASAATIFALTRPDDVRWSAFPHTAACTEEKNGLDMPSNSTDTTVKTATLEHLGEQKIAVTIDFAVTAPPTPRLVTSPYSDEPVFEAGSFVYNLLVGADEGSVFTALTKDGWGAARLDLAVDEGLGDPVPEYTQRNFLADFERSARSVRFVYDLDGQPNLFGDGPFTPEVRVNAFRVGPPVPDSVRGGSDTYYASQLCSWNPAARTDNQNSAPVSPQLDPPALDTRPSSSSTDQNDCGPDANDALTDALTTLPPEPNTGREWDPVPIGSNFDACADLSAIMVGVEGGTASSPVQALMFHRGEYLGTGTSEAYGFTELDLAASTDDTVVLTYETGQSCNACDDGVVTSVRFQWDGRSVQMLDNPPN
jgi:hypothetical protein